MTQNIILNKLIKFLEYERDDYLLDLEKQVTLSPQHAKRIIQQKEEFIESNQKLRESLAKGHCFGLSLTHAAMDYLEKLDWWEHVLISIAHWDELSSSLNNEFKFPGTVQNQQTETTLKDIMSQALNYIVTSHPGPTTSYFPMLDHKNIMHPDGYEALEPATKKDASQSQLRIQRSYFEVLDENSSEVKTIKKRETISGNFTKEQLINIFADNLSEKAIILVHNYHHTIRIARKGTHWMVYDPNYSHNKTTTIHKIGSKSDCINEIIRIHSPSSIAIEVASFDEQEPIYFPEYVHLLKTSTVTLLEGNGLLMISQYNPLFLPGIVKYIDDSIEGRALLTAIAQAMTEKTDDGWSALHMIAQHSPATLVDLLQRADNSIEGRALLTAIAQAMTEKTTSGGSALYVIAQHSPATLVDLLQRADDSIEGRTLLTAIAQAMTEKTNKGWTALHLIARYSPATLVDLLKRADNSIEGRTLLTAIAQAMTEKNNEGWTALHLIARYSSAALVDLLKRANDSLEGRTLLAAIAQTMTEKNNEGWTTLHLIARYSPAALVDLIKHADDSIQGSALLTALAQAMTEKTNTGWTALHMIAQHSPTTLINLLQRKEHSIEGSALLAAFAQAMTEKNDEGWTALHVIARYSPAALVDLIKHADNSIEGRALLTAIAQAMTEKTNAGWTALHSIAQHSPAALLDLLKRVDNSIEGKALLTAITQAMAEKTNTGWTALHLIARYSPAALVDLVKHVDDSIEGRALFKAITQALIEKTLEKGVMYTMAITAPDILLYIVAGIDNSPGKKEATSKIPILSLLNIPQGLDILLKILSAKTINNKTIWQYLGAKSPRTKEHIIEGICKHLAKMNNTELAVYEKEINHALSDKNAMYRGICKTHTLFHGRYVKTDLYLKMKKTIKDTMENNSQEMVKEQTPKFGS